MKKFICLTSVIICVIYSLYYASLGGFHGNKGALSKIGLTHPLLFSVWGILTLTALFINIITAYSKAKFNFYKYLLIISFIGMALTLIFDFDYNERLQYYLHCIGSMSFSVVTGITVLLFFIISKRYILTAMCTTILLTDLILLIIFKETAIIELFPIFSGFILLLIYNFRKERNYIEIKQ